MLLCRAPSMPSRRLFMSPISESGTFERSPIELRRLECRSRDASRGRGCQALALLRWKILLPALRIGIGAVINLASAHHSVPIRAEVLRHRHDVFQHRRHAHRLLIFVHARRRRAPARHQCSTRGIADRRGAVGPVNNTPSLRACRYSESLRQDSRRGIRPSRSNRRWR